MPLLPDRAEVARFARRFRVEGYELEDLIQEVYIALLENNRPSSHLWSLNKQMRKQPKTVMRRDDDDNVMRLVEDDSLHRVEENLDALVLLIAARSECDTLQDDWLLTQLLEGSGYKALCDEWKCSEDAAWQRVCRFRNKMYPRLYEEVK